VSGDGFSSPEGGDEVEIVSLYIEEGSKKSARDAEGCVVCAISKEGVGHPTTLKIISREQLVKRFSDNF
jgi:ribosomal protein L19